MRLLNFNLKFLIRILILLILCQTSMINAANAEIKPVKKWKVSDSLTIQEIAPGIWVHTSWRKLANGIPFPANGMLVRNGNELVLIDTAWGADITEELFHWIDSQLKLPVTIAIVTHFHDDSMGGSPVLVKRHVPFVGLPLTRELGKKEGVPLPGSIGDLQVGDAVMIANVEVFYPGPAHTRDNIVVWVPEARVLFGTCMIRSPALPGKGNTADADQANWPIAARLLRQKYPDAGIVVPGHGPVGDASLLTHTMNLFKG